MKSFIAIASWFVLSSTAFATQNLNPISCVYFHRNSAWEFYGVQYSNKNFDLKNGQSVMVMGAWTSDRPASPNYAVCTTITGTADANSVGMTQMVFAAPTIFDIVDICNVRGNDVKKLSEQKSSLARGSSAQLESEWLIAPAPDKIVVKTYLPTLEETTDIKKFAEAKCIELTP